MPLAGRLSVPVQRVVDENRVKRLLSAEAYVEDVPSEELAAAVATARYLPTLNPAECAGFDVAVVTRPHA